MCSSAAGSPMLRPGDDERRGRGRQPRDSLPTGRWSGPSLAITSPALSRRHGPHRSAESNVGCAGRSATRPPEPPLIARTRPSTTLSPDAPYFQIASLPAASMFVHALAVATKCNIRHCRIVICVVFLSPSRRLRRPRSHLSRVPPTYRKLPCDRARNIRDNIRQRRVGSRPRTSITYYESYSYDDARPSYIADDPSSRPPSRGN